MWSQDTRYSSGRSMKTYRQMAIWLHRGASRCPSAASNNGAVFSPTQAMIDLDMNEAIYRFARGMDVDDDTCAVDLIHELLFCEDRTYLETEHTVGRYRSIGWYPRLFDRIVLRPTPIRPVSTMKCCCSGRMKPAKAGGRSGAAGSRAWFRKRVGSDVKAARTELLAQPATKVETRSSYASAFPPRSHSPSSRCRDPRLAPLALARDRRLDERRQRALCGTTAMRALAAIAVASTRTIWHRDPQVGL